MGRSVVFIVVVVVGLLLLFVPQARQVIWMLMEGASNVR